MRSVFLIFSLMCVLFRENKLFAAADVLSNATTKNEQDNIQHKYNSRNNYIRTNSTRNSSHEEEDERSRRTKEESEKIKLQNEARRRRGQIEREREGAISARLMMMAGSDENCDWRTQPLSLLRGEICGVGNMFMYLCVCMYVYA